MHCAICPVWWISCKCGIDFEGHQPLHSPSLPAPSQPQNFTVVSVTSTVIMLSWQPPATLNGIIIRYSIWVFKRSSCNSSVSLYSRHLVLQATAITQTFSELEEDALYEFKILAETSAGEGETAMVMGRTREDGECACV